MDAGARAGGPTAAGASRSRLLAGASRCRLELLLGAIYAAAAAVLALGWHPIEVPGGESDLYVLQAEQLLRGGLPNDQWHPVYYPILIAAMTGLTGDVFAAAKLVSAVCGGILVFAAATLARRLFGAPAAWLAGTLLAVHGTLAVLAAQAAADVPALALAMLAMTMAARAVPPADKRLFAGGILAGLAIGMRFQMAPLLPALSVAALTHSPRARRCLVLLAGWAAGYLPQALCSWLVFGSPFHSEHWRNLAFKAVHEYDSVAAFQRDADTTMTSFMAAHWREVVGAALRDLGRQLGGDLGSFTAARPLGLGGSLLVAAIAVACWRAWRDPAARCLIAFGGLYLPMLCCALVPIDRYLLPMLPVAALALASLRRLAASRLLRAVLQLPVMAAIAVAIGSLPAHLGAFLASHPLGEVAAARELRRALTAGDAIASPYSPMRRHVDGCILWVDLHAMESRQGRELLDRISDRASAMHFEFLVVGPATSARLHASLRDCRGIGDHACAVETWSDQVAVVHWRPPPGPVRRVLVDVDPDGNRAHLGIELAADQPDAGAVLAAVLRLRGPGGERMSVLLQRRSPTRFAIDWPRRLPAGLVQLDPALMLVDGSLRSGARAEFAIGPDGRLQR